MKIPRQNPNNFEGDTLTKLIKKGGNGFLYWYIWKDGMTLKVHSGSVGDIGETREIQLSLSEKANESIDELVNQKIKEGFRYIEEHDLIDLLVEYNYKKDKIEETLKKRHYMQDIIDESLFWTGNGYCDGGGMGMGVAQIFNYVIDVKKAAKEITKELENENLVEGVKISYLNRLNGQYITLYPS
ncbi:hypothetical protein ACW4EZ_25265 [Bacillus toyonensis]|uniref:hypothetical protein n=1 Tax=Bacillus thuringiensis TaxID=1428 RepID=UPI000B449E42|nr:hypothetical protein [Bacillus thuringiensis]MED1303103.1 hypothetical protein [Bacillus pacificus]PFW00717.1 hypothetical protein COL22_29060 [Bacillus thuringiensis]